MKKYHHWRDLISKLLITLIISNIILIGCGIEDGENVSLESRPLSYTDNGDGTISDNNTALMWQKIDSDQDYNWYEANGEIDATYNPGGSVDVCGALQLGGHTDWRLPTIEELESIVKYDSSNPAIATAYFSNAHSSMYWASTTYFFYVPRARVVDFSMGGLWGSELSNPYFVKCVRGNFLEIGDFIDNNDGTVSNDLSGLMWQQDTGPLSNFNDAKNYCDQLVLAGFDDWVVPSVWELSTIIDFNTVGPAIDVSFFPDTYTSAYYQTRNHSTDGSHTSWSINFTYGTSHPGGANQLHWVRCVR